MGPSYYLVRGTIQITKYMVDGCQTIDDFRLVYASCMVDAEEIFEKYWNDQSTSFGSTYTVIRADAQETLGRE